MGCNHNVNDFQGLLVFNIYLCAELLNYFFTILSEKT